MLQYLVRWMLLLTWIIMSTAVPAGAVNVATVTSVASDLREPVDRVATKAVASAFASMSGEAVVRESIGRHDFYPYIYEEQTLILVDANEQRDVRRIRRYSRVEKDGTFKLLIEFVYPESIAGTVLLFKHNSDGQHSRQIFLPSLGAKMTRYTGDMSGGQMLGSEFSTRDFMPEDTASFAYQREPDTVDDGVAYFRVRATPRANHSVASAGFARRLLFIRQDNFFVSRIDYFDSQGRLLKRQTRHDIHRVGGEMWRADLISMQNMLNRYRSILKIDRRVYSRGYVPEEVFSEDRILAAASRQTQGSGNEAVGVPDDDGDTPPQKPIDTGKVK